MDRYAILLHHIGVTHKKLHLLWDMGEDFEAMYTNLSFEKLKMVYEKPEQIEKILEAKRNIEEEKIFSTLEKLWVTPILFDTPKYPTLLKQLYSPPFILYVQWTLDNRPTLWVVWSRKMTDYGKKVIENIVPDVAKYFTIVSGGAFGCDTYAHQVTLKAKQKTIVVVGTGIDIVYPQVNESLYKQVIDTGGAVVSIFPLGTSGSNFTFPMRNEIIAGISQWVLVVEAAKESGSLITAKLALDQSREVFAIPWDIFHTNSAGCTELIKKGEAKLVSRSQDILEEYNIALEWQTTLPTFQFSQDERYIYEILTTEEKSIDTLAKTLWKDVGSVSVYLSSLELKGAVVKLSTGKYQIR